MGETNLRERGLPPAYSKGVPKAEGRISGSGQIIEGDGQGVGQLAQGGHRTGLAAGFDIGDLHAVDTRGRCQRRLGQAASEPSWASAWRDRPSAFITPIRVDNLGSPSWLSAR